MNFKTGRKIKKTNLKTLLGTFKATQVITKKTRQIYRKILY